MSNEINKNLFSSDSVLDNLQPQDSTVEVIGYVDTIIGRHLVGDTVKYEVFKFFPKNASGKTVQVLAWADIIAKVEDLFTVNSVVHIDGAMSKLPKKTQFNVGNVSCELIIQNTTEVSVLGVYNEIPEISLPKEVEIQNTRNMQGRITVRGYVKTVFAKLKYQYTTVGSITDGIYKLEIRLPLADDLSFVKGELISATGILKQYKTGPPSLSVNNIADMKKLGGAKMSFQCLLNGFNMP